MAGVGGIMKYNFELSQRQTSGETLDEILKDWRYDPEKWRFDEFKRRHQINPDLEHLELGGASWIGSEMVEWDKENIEDQDIAYIAKNCPKLKTLRLENLRNVTTIATGVLSTSTMDFPSLTFLHASSCRKLDNFRIAAPLLERLEVLDNTALKSPQARVQFSAKIQKSPFSRAEVDRRSLEDSDLELIKDSSVESLDLSYCEGVTDEGLQPLTKLPLKRVSLRGCKKLSSEGIKKLTTNSQTLKEIDLGDIPQLRLSHNFLGDTFSYSRLDLSDNPQLTDSSFTLALFTGVTTTWGPLSISNCPNLTSRFFHSLKFSPVIRANHLPQLTDDSLKYLYPDILLKLSIAKCKQITDAGLKTLESIKTLRMLNVKGCPQVTLRGILSLSKAIPGIKIIHDLDLAPQ